MPKTLLLADDSVTIQKVVGLSFANEDVILLTADNGDQALARIREQRPDLVLADVVMPGKNGYEVCEAIKADPTLRHIPVLLLTGTFEAFDEERAQRVGAEGHITKPFEAQALVDQVNSLLARAPQAAESRQTGETETAEPVTTGVYDFFADDVEAGEAALVPAGVALASEPAVVALDEDEDLPMPMAPRPAATARPIEIEPEPAAASRFDTDPLAESVGSGAALFGDGPEEVWPSASGDETHAILHEDELAPLETDDLETSATTLAATDLFDDDAFEVESSSGSRSFDSLSPRPPAAAPPALVDEEAYDFGFDETPTARPVAPAVAAAAADSLGTLGYDDLSRETVIDPEAARGYDVSWSDLGDPLADARPINSPSAVADGMSLPSLALSAPPTLPARGFTTAPKTPPRAPAFATPTPVPSETTAPSKPTATASVAAAAVTSATPVPDLTPVLRQRVHETLEKIAWEAFSDLSDTIVRQLVERVESIAWEVIPQMAEVLIREEIRRLKGEDGSR